MNDNAQFPSKEDALKLPRTTGYRVGVGEIAIAVKGRKVPKGTYGLVVAFGQPRSFGGGRGFYARGYNTTVSALVQAPNGEMLWVNSENLEKLELNNWEQSILTVRSGQSRAEFIKKVKYELDEVTFLDLCVMVSAQLNSWNFKSVANFYMQNYNAVERVQNGTVDSSHR